MWEDLVRGSVEDNRFGFEETAWLLLFGRLPTREQLESFASLLSECRELPDYFAEDMIIKAPSPNIMNKLARSVLALYSYDDNPDDLSTKNVLRQSIELIAMLPTIMGYAYQVKRRHYDRESMYVHPLEPGLSTSETILRTIRADASYTDEEAKLLDLCLMLHAEHGGGNNSTFAARVLSSSGTDTYSAIAAAIGALKGPSARRGEHQGHGDAGGDQGRGGIGTTTMRSRRSSKAHPQGGGRPVRQNLWDGPRSLHPIRSPGGHTQAARPGSRREKGYGAEFRLLSRLSGSPRGIRPPEGQR